ncbi:MAG: hypothetical protein SGPRY_007958, partial [Prymnesium sp.]
TWVPWNPMLFAPLLLSLPRPPLLGAVRSSRASSLMAAGNEAVSFAPLDGSQVRIGIIKARWHEPTVDALIAGAKRAMLEECGVKSENIVETEVPGSFELPLAARYLALSGTVDAIIPVGVLINGDTYHFQAKDRSTGSNNHGEQWGKAAVEMALLRSSAFGKQKKMFLGFGGADEEQSQDTSLTGTGKPMGF